MTSKFEGLAHNALREASKASKRSGQDARFVEKASLQAATVYAMLSLNDKLEEVLGELRELRNKG